jgi:phytoene synthase
MISENLLAKYAKSFNWAGFFLPNKEFQKSSTVYSFCRILDDIVDGDYHQYDFVKKSVDELASKQNI